MPTYGNYDDLMAHIDLAVESRPNPNSRLLSVIGQLRYSGGEWQPWVLKQDAVWIDKYQNVHLIASMDVSYIENVLTFLRDYHAAEVGDPLNNPLVKKLIAVREVKQPATARRDRKFKAQWAEALA